MSGVDLDGRQLRKGAADAIAAFVKERGGDVPSRIHGDDASASRARAARRSRSRTAAVCSA